MRSFLTVTSAADDLHLLTAAERRVAAGLVSTDTSQDTALAARSLAVAAGITSECGIATGSSADPTLKQETLTQTLYAVEVEQLILARRHNIEITSITEDGTALTEDTDFLVEPESGLVTRLSGDCPIRWCAQKIVVVYTAGFETIPGDLKQAASDYMRALTLELTRDPYVKAESVEVPGLESRRTELWTGTLPGDAGGVPPMVAAQLTRFRNPIVA